MEIKSTIYSELSPTQRAIACFSAVNRGDVTETDRLFGHAPKDVRHRQALISIGQAMDTYNRFSAKTTSSFLIVSAKLQAALSFCAGWLEAGGSVDAPSYLKNAAITERLNPVAKQLASEVVAVRQGTLEWCEDQKVPMEIFSEPLCHLSLNQTDAAEPDSETLLAVRSVFDKITLFW